MKKQRIILKILLFAVVCLLGGCSEKENGIQPENKIVQQKTEAERENTDEQEKQVNDTEDKTTVIWTIPDLIDLADISRNIELLNEKLLEDGYSFSVSIKTLPNNTYREELVELLTSGGTDIAFLGINNAGSGWSIDAEDLVREGYFEELTDYLASESGQKLKQEYCEDEWKVVETDGKIYSIPTQLGVKGNGYWAFNKKYVTEEMLQNYSGSVQELGAILDQIEIPEGVYSILGGFGMYELAQMCGCEYRNGVFIDLETGVAENPYLNEEFYGELTELHSLAMKGYFGKNGTNLSMSESRKQQEMEKKNFVVCKSFSYDDIYERIKEDVFVVPSVFAMPSTLSLSTGISVSAANKEAALQFLTLIYTEDVYANLLLYGKEGEDYQIIEGYVCDMQGNAMQAFLKNLIFGVYDHALPCRGDALMANRNEMKQELYNSKYRLESVLQGFQLDRGRFDDQMLALNNITDKYSNIWQREDFETAWTVASQTFEEEGGQKVVDELNQQIQVWMEGK